MSTIRRIRSRSGDRKELEGWVRARTTTTPQRRAERARIVLASANGLSRQALSRKIGGSLPTVQRWLNRYDPEGLRGLEDRARPGRARSRVAPVPEAEIVRRTLKEPPHRVRHFKLSTSPEFVDKLRDVVGLYVASPERAVVFSFDEKSQIQALDRTQPRLPLRKRRCGTMTHDYRRHGTTMPFAALAVATGEVIHRCLRRHRHQEFLGFMRTVENQTDPELELHFILESYATHKHAKAKAWLEKHPRVHFHFVPTWASWLNLVEELFSELTQLQLRRPAVHSADELVEAITNYRDDRNRTPTPFVWTATVKDILSKVSRANETLAATPHGAYLLS